jgi:hypothetical protein
METPQDTLDRQMEDVKKQATILLTKIDDNLLNQIHAVINRMPGSVAVACLSAALADCIAHLSKTQDGVTRNVLMVSEAILKMASAGLEKKNEEQKLN